MRIVSRLQWITKNSCFFLGNSLLLLLQVNDFTNLLNINETVRIQSSSLESLNTIITLLVHSYRFHYAANASVAVHSLCNDAQYSLSIGLQPKHVRQPCEKRGNRANSSRMSLANLFPANLHGCTFSERPIQFDTTMMCDRDRLPLTVKMFEYGNSNTFFVIKW